VTLSDNIILYRRVHPNKRQWTKSYHRLGLVCEVVDFAQRDSSVLAVKLNLLNKYAEVVDVSDS
jgi:hypothetical protein